MQPTTWYPYAPDQEFGVRFAADQELLEQAINRLDAIPRVPPRPANKAPVPGSVVSSTSLARRVGVGPPMWPAANDLYDGPVTTATALDAATEVGRSRG